MYEELRDVVQSRGAMLFFLPPYSPHLNPIEVGFSLVKRWIQRQAHLAYKGAPELVLDVAFASCASKDPIGLNLYSHCGYETHGLSDE
ncbi:hypothetical protein BGX28_002584, partial [Mortierella sp. GBA30]